MQPPLLRPPAAGDPDFIGPYRVHARLGGGGFGTVYAASGPDGELVAVKIVHRQLLDGEHDFRARFGREIQAMERVESDFVPALLNGRTADELPWLATELVPGVSLEKLVYRCGPLPEEAVWRLAAGVAEGLAAVHAAGLFHRDMKPHNVLLTPDRPWIIDFGLVRLSELPHHDSSVIVMATCEYAPPEQLEDGLRGASKPADIFSFGGTLLFAATGHPPRQAENLTQLLRRAMNAPPDLDGLPRGLHRLVASCLAHEAADRPALDQVRAEIAGHAQAVVGEGFREALPDKVISLLGDFREDLAALLRARGPLRLGWSTPDAPDASMQLPPVGEFDSRMVAKVGQEPLTPTQPDGPGQPVATQAMTQPLTVWDRVSALRRPREAKSENTQDRETVRVRNLTPRAGEALAEDEAWRHEPVLTRKGRLAREAAGQHWTRSFGGWICAPVAVHADMCVVACRDGTVWGLRAADGAECWRADLGGPVGGGPVIMPQAAGPGGVAFAAAPDGSLQSFDLATGEHRAVLPAGDAIEGTPVSAAQYGRRVLYVVRSGGGLYAVGQRVGRDELVRQLDGGATGALATTAEVIAAADSKGTVQLINPSTGRLIRRLCTDGLVLGAPVLTADRVYAAGTDGGLYWADMTGPAEGALAGFAPVHAAPVSRSGYLYVGDSDGRVHACEQRERDSRGPARNWRSDPLGAEIVGLAVTGGTLYAAAGRRLYALDLRSGEVIGVVIEANCLIGAAPVIAGKFGYLVGLGGVVDRFAVRDS